MHAVTECNTSLVITTLRKRGSNAKQNRLREKEGCKGKGRCKGRTRIRINRLRQAKVRYRKRRGGKGGAKVTNFASTENLGKKQ